MIRCGSDTSCIPVSPPDASQQDPSQDVPPLYSLYLYISGACNLSCRHCWITPTHKPSGNGKHYVRPAYVRKAIQEAKSLGLVAVKLTGGEPLLHPEFQEIVRRIGDEECGMHIETNGTLVNKRIASFLARTKRLSSISVSLDGSDAATHEELRGSGSFEQTLSGIRHLSEQGIYPQLICTLHKGNASKWAGIIRLALRLGCESVKFNSLQRIGRGAHFAREHGLTVRETISLYRDIEHDARSTNDIDIHFDIPLAFRSIRDLLEGRPDRCTVKNIMGMLSDGSLSLCGIGVMVRELIFGHVEANDLREVWRRSPKLTRLRTQIPVKLEGICAECIHRNVCLGACVANNFYHTRKISAPYLFCHTARELGLFPLSRLKDPRTERDLEGFATKENR